MSLVLSCIWNAIGNAQDFGRNLVVAFDQETAKQLPAKSVLGVLVSDSNDADETINERALAMRHATYFVYPSGHGSTLAAMYRERLQMQGVVAVELPRPGTVKRRNSPAWLSAEAKPLPFPQALLANHQLRGPQD